MRRTTRAVAVAIASVCLWAAYMQGASMRAYDCDGRGTRFESISLLETEACPDPRNDFEDPIDVTVHIIQNADERDVDGVKCRFKLNKRIVHCGFDSLCNHEEYTLRDEPIHMSAYDCWEA